MLQEVVQIGLSAGALIERAAAAGISREFKADGSPVSSADREADLFIRMKLSCLAPGIPCLSEEAEVPSYPERMRWKEFWLVDPLDGTKEFLAGRDDFTVNIALI